MKGPVIIPLDGSKLAKQAIPLGYSIAQHTDSEILLLQVMPKELNPIPANSDKSISIEEQAGNPLALAETYLQSVADQLKREGGPVVSYAVVFGTPGESIAQEANEREASYVVMSTHGYTGFTRWMLGSVADRVLHLTERPLLLMRPPDEAEYEGIPKELSDLPQVKRIVVPLEGLPLAEQILPHAKALAEAYGKADIRLFHAIPAFPAGLVPVHTAQLKQQWLALSHKEAESYLGKLVNELRAEGNTVQFAIRVGMPAEEILEYAAEVEADLVMMTTHAREGLSRFLLGSVTDRIVRAGQVPVMVVHPTDSSA